MHDEIGLLPLRKDVEYIPILHGKSGQLPLPRMRKEKDSLCKAFKRTSTIVPCLVVGSGDNNNNFRRINMDKKEKVGILLDCIDKYAPVNVNWNMEKFWRMALEKGLEKIEEKEKCWEEMK